MGMGTIGLIGGIGKGISEAGTTVGKFGAMLAEMDEKRKARLEEIRAEWAERNAAEVSKEQRTEQRLQDTAKRFEPMFGVDSTPKTQADFVKAKPLIGSADQGPPEELSGPPEMVDDAEAYGRYEKGQDRGRAMADLAARRPEAIDDIQKATNAEKMGGLLDDAIKNKDWSAVARISAAIKGAGTWKGMGSGLAIDEITGEIKETDVSESIIDENRAQGARARSGATNDHARDVSSMAAERVKQLQAQYERIQSETFKEPKNVYDPKEIERLRGEWETKQEARLRDVGAKLEKAEREYETAYGDLSARRGIGSGRGGAKPKAGARPGSRPPLTAFEN